MLIDSSKQWQPDADMVSVLPGEGVWHCQSRCVGVQIASVTAQCKTNAECYFHFLCSFVKTRILLGFIFLNENRYQGTFFIKVKWHQVNFRKAGDSCTYIYSC